MKKAFRFLLPVLFLSLGVGGFMALKASRPLDPPVGAGEKAWPVATVSVKRETLSPTIALYGRVESPRQTRLRAAVSADVVSVNVFEGDTVSGGDPVLNLDDRDLGLLLQQREAELAEIEAQIESEKRRYAADLTALDYEQTLLELAEKSASRARTLANTQAGSEAGVDEAEQAVRNRSLSIANRQRALDDHEPRLAQLKARHLKSSALRNQALRDLERTKVRAPFNGRIVSVAVSPGDRVRVGDLLVELYDTRLVEVRAQIPNRHLRTIRAALETGGAVSASLTEEGRRYQLRLDRLAASIEAGRGGVDAFFRFASDRIGLELGRTVTVDIELPSVTDVIAIPVTAIYGANRVYRLVDDRLSGVTVNRAGEYLADDGSRWSLISSDDLMEGDRVVATQIPSAVDGLKVTDTGQRE